MAALHGAQPIADLGTVSAAGAHVVGEGVGNASARGCVCVHNHVPVSPFLIHAEVLIRPPCHSAAITGVPYGKSVTTELAAQRALSGVEGRQRHVITVWLRHVEA